MPKTKSLIILLTLILMASCQSTSQVSKDILNSPSIISQKLNQNLPRTQIQINSHTYTVELAQTPMERQIGLQNRSELKADQGMFFIFEHSEIRNFWMKDTLIPLDIIYLNSDYQITQIYSNTPTCQSIDPSQTTCPHYLSSKPAHYVLELKANQTQKDKIKVGDTLIIKNTEN
jgi:uncharacterized membrane protein (UPF0127 family)